MPFASISRANACINPGCLARIVVRLCGGVTTRAPTAPCSWPPSADYYFGADFIALRATFRFGAKIVASQRPRSELHLASSLRTIRPTPPADCAASVGCRSSDSVAPKGDSMQHKSVSLRIKGADDHSGAFTGLASVFDKPRP